MNENTPAKTNPLVTETVWLMAELTAELNQAPDLESLCEVLRRQLGWLFDYDRCTLALRLDSSLDHFTLLEITRLAHPLYYDTSVIPLADNWPSRVLLEGKPVFVDDAELLPLLPSDPMLGVVKAARSLMLVPLYYNNQIIGSLNFSTRQVKGYPVAWRNLLSMLVLHLSNKLGSLLIPPVQEVKVTPAQQTRARLERRLAQAMENSELSLVYQPQISANSHQLVGVEALLRWYDPQVGQISPVTFIPMAEETGLIVKLGQWVLEQACQRAVEWQKAGFAPFKVCVNVSAVQLEQSDFVKTVTSVLKKSQLAPRYLELELTESLLVKDVKQTAVQINQLRALGVEIAIDDFGTGYSSLQYLQDLPLDTLKIDRSFIQALGLSNPVSHIRPNQGAIIGAIITLAHALNLKVVAEGVESLSELEMLSQLGCDIIQGYFFSPPLRAEELTNFLKQQLVLNSQPKYLMLVS